MEKEEKIHRNWCWFSDKYLVDCLHQSFVFNAVAMERRDITPYICGHITFPSCLHLLICICVGSLMREMQIGVRYWFHSMACLRYHGHVGWDYGMSGRVMDRGCNAHEQTS